MESIREGVSDGSVAIRDIFIRHIDEELERKEREVITIEDHIRHTKLLLQRLRLGLLVQNWDHKVPVTLTERSISWAEFEKQFTSTTNNGHTHDVHTPLEQDSIPNHTSSNHTATCSTETNSLATSMEYDQSRDESCDQSRDESCDQDQVLPIPTESTRDEETSRFYISRRVIVGNTTVYLDKSIRQSELTHKWMAYVRSDLKDPPLHTYVSAVKFFLHPTYRPHDIITVSKPPFTLTKYGWGEFPLRVQLLFSDPRHKPVDIIHNLKLDRIHVGQQVLGAETVVKIELSKYQLGLPGGVASQVEPQPVTVKPATPTNNTDSDVSDNQTQFQGVLDISSVSLPISHPWEAVLLDHDYCRPIITRQHSARSAITTDMEALLHQAARHITLYNCKQPLEVCPFAAPSLEDFNKYSVIRQRANEWMRGVALCKHIQATLGIRPSTRQVMYWCRTHGYTPLHPGLTFCRLCGYHGNHHHGNDEQDVEPSITDTLELYSSVVELDDRLRTAATDNEVTVDVVPSSPAPSFTHLYRIPSSPELRWVHETACDIGVYIQPIQHDKMLLHVVEHMIFSASSQFLAQLLQSSVSIGIRKPSHQKKEGLEERILVPHHIHRAILRVEIFDFLSNKHFGF